MGYTYIGPSSFYKLTIPEIKKLQRGFSRNKQLWVPLAGDGEKKHGNRPKRSTPNDVEREQMKEMLKER
ncbi:MAG: hypothetical protein ABEI54_01905 [Candidatus Bipolaricaulia bacterium]